MLEEIDPSTIEDGPTRQLVIKLLNLLDKALHQIDLLKAENQALRDENNRLKGEQAKPEFKPLTPNKNLAAPKPTTLPPKKEPKRGKKAKLVLTLTQKLTLDRQNLPKDVQFKGYQSVIVQEVIFRPEVILFQKEKFYSPSTQMTYLAPLPPGFTGQFGPGLKALVLQLYYQANLSEPKLLELLHTFGFQISAAQISNWLIHDHQALFEAEKHQIVKAGLASSSWQHFDHTSTRAMGKTQACHVVCNPYYTAFTTLPQRDRLSVLKVLLGGQPPTFCYNQQAQKLLVDLGLPHKWTKHLKSLEVGRLYSHSEIQTWLDTQAKGLGHNGRKWVFDALAIAAYHTQSGWPVVKTLVCDDAPVFNLISEQLALCWIHEGRHYTKLEPRLAYHRKLLADFQGRFWRFYDQLLDYTQKPTSSKAEWLSTQFDELFKAGGEYEGLDAQKAKTRAKREQLLLILEQPYLPLHNNPAELGARQRVRKRDVSLAAASQAGLRGWDALQSVVATAKKLGVNVYHYLLDRVSGKNEMISLAQAITNKATHSGSEPNLYYPSERSRERSHQARTKHKTSASLSPPKSSRAKPKVVGRSVSLSLVGST